MPIDALSSAITAAARAQTAEILAQAEQQAVRLRADAAAARDRRLAAALRAHEEALRRELDGRLSGRRREVRARVFAARDALLARVFDATQQALPAEPAQPALRATFEARLRAALALLEGDVVVQCAPAFAAIAEAVAASRPSVRVEPDPALANGFRARAAGDAVEIDATLPQLLALQRPQLAIALLAALDEAGAQPAPALGAEPAA